MAALSPEEVENAVRAYEVMVILDPNLDERTVQPSLDKYLDNVIRKSGGSVDTAKISIAFGNACAKRSGSSFSSSRSARSRNQRAQSARCP